ncbi:MAG: hypothetical protein WAT41_14330 [Flavobacteriales bacterium]
MKNKGMILGALLIFGACVFLSLNWHSHSPKFTYHSEIWADRAGYHVYLPAVFDYNFDPKAFPDGIDRRTGSGFYLDSIPGRVVTKYPCGEAMLRVPFYLIGKALRSPEDPLGAGFTMVDHAMVDVAASFYGVLGLLLLFWTLTKRIKNSAALASLFAILTGTNLLFYLIGDPGMSHVYSFFLFSAFIFAIQDVDKPRPKAMHNILLGMLAGLIVVTRPTNIFFIPLAFVVTALSWADLVARIKSFVLPRHLLPFIAGATIMCIPQMLYWQYAFGTPIKWSYGQEGFVNALDPQVIKFWFAPHNGLFPYSPIIALVLVGGSRYSRSMKLPVLGAWLTFLLVSYIGASWFAWAFGCGYGSRNFVEYGAIFAFPLGYLLDQRTKWHKVISILVLACCIISLKLTFSSAICWFGTDWDWSMYLHFIFGPFE